MQRPARLLERLPDGRVRLGDVRNGFTEPPEGAAGGFNNTWEPRWTQITVDPSKLTGYSLIVEPFTPEWAAGHVMGMFEFSEPIPGLGTKQLVVSMEARLREGETYGLLKGLKKTFQPVFQLCSLGDRVQKSCRGQGHRMVVHKLELEPQQVRELFDNSINEVTRDHSKEWYHTTRNSCYTTQTDLINSVIESPIPRWLIPGVVERPSWAFPGSAGLTLLRNGLLGKEPARLLQPDRTLHPDLQVRPGKLRQTLHKASQNPVWGPACTLAGAALGGYAGHALAGLPGLALGALGAGYAANMAADYAKVQTHVAPQPCESLYPQA